MAPFQEFQQIFKKSSNLIAFETSLQHYIIQSFTGEQNLIFKYCYQLYSFLAGNQQHLNQEQIQDFYQIRSYYQDGGRETKNTQMQIKWKYFFTLI
jgi:hypothetical protein